MGRGRGDRARRAPGFGSGACPPSTPTTRTRSAGRFALDWRALVVAGTLVALALGFRSVLVPLKAMALNLLSVAGSFGALVLVFQDGHGVRWLGLARPVDGVFPIVPVLVFCTVFGLSLDYEVFLVARVAEGRRQGLSEERPPWRKAWPAPAGVITSAAAIMVAVFAAFTLGGFVLHEDARVRAGGGRAPRRDGDPHGRGPGAAAPGRPLELVARGSRTPLVTPQGFAAAFLAMIFSISSIAQFIAPRGLGRAPGWRGPRRPP